MALDVARLGSAKMPRSVSQPTRLAVGTALDPVDLVAVGEEELRRASSYRRNTMLVFFGGLALAAAVWLILPRH